MSKESPKDLDKLFQQEPEQYPYGYNEASWQEMEKLLDKDDRRRFLWWWFLGIGALLLIGSIFFFGKSETEMVDTNLDLDKKEIVENQNRNSNSEIETSILNSENQNPKSEVPNENVALNSNIVPNKNESNNSKSTANKNSQQYNYKNKKGDSRLTFDDAEFQKNKIGNTVLSDSNFEKMNESSNDLILKKIEQGNTKIDSVNVLLDSNIVVPIAFLQILIPEEKSHIEIPFLEKNKEEDLPRLPPKNKNKVLFGILLGTESTGANFSNLSQPNWKIGAQLEYRFLHRFSASIGANYIRKKYAATGDDYNPNDDWLYNIAPQTVDAICDFLEVPVNIGFFQKRNNKNGFYSKLGLTSFIMLEEHYWYFYEDSLPGQSRYWGGYNENKHWFGIGEVYVGYQYMANSITSLQIEPYFQIPLTGVGNGNVKLWSIGMNLRVNFQAN